MNDENRVRRYVTWAVLGLIVVSGIAIVASLVIPWGAGGYHRPFFPFWGIGGILVIIAVFWVARWFFWPRGRWGYGQYRYYGDSAQDILRQRYAKGEITKEQYEQMMRDLSKSPSSQG